MQSLLLKARGLNTFNNNLSEVPEGSLNIADNVVIDRNGVIEPRRGFAIYGNSFGSGADRAKQLTVYKNRLLRHASTLMQYDDGTGLFTSFSGLFTETESGLRIKSTEANGNFYFTTDQGIMRISAATASDFTPAAGFIRTAGGTKALDLTGTVDYSSPGFFTPQSKVAYRITWAFKDANTNLVEGVPSSRLVVTNFSDTATGFVQLSSAIPSQISSTDTQFFYRIYRTAVVTTAIGVDLTDVDPGDEMNLIIEDFPTPAELTARQIGPIADITPETFRQGGALLYTNPVSGEGILQANYPPPLAKDIALFQGSVFYANTQTKQNLNVSLLSVQDLISNTSSISVHQGATTNTYTFRGTKEQTQFTLDTAANTNTGGYFLLNSASNSRRYFVWYGFAGAMETTPFTFDTQANTTSGGYFLINSANDASKYFVWFDKTGSTATPSGADTVGRIGLKVNLVNLTTSTEVATAVSQVLPASDFAITQNNNVLLVQNVIVGSTTDAVAGIVPPGGAFAIGSITQGTDATVQPSTAQTAGKLPIFVDKTGLTSAVDVSTATTAAINNITDFTATNEFSFTVTAANATAGAVYTNNLQNFTVLTTISGGTTLLTHSSGSPTASGTLTKVSGTGDATITFSSVTQLAKTVVTNNDNGNTDDATNGTNPVGGAFAISVLFQGTGEDQATLKVLLGGSASTSQNIDETARSLVNIINNNPLEVINAFYLSGPDDVPGLMLFEARNLATPAFYITANSTLTGNEFSPSFPTSGQTAISTNEVEPNAIYYSKFQQPEAVPFVNKFNVGPKDKAILRILPLRTGLIVLKEDGIYRVTGQNATFTLDPFDNSAILLAPDSAVVLNNQIYMFSTQGVTTVTDTGVSVISRPIEDKLDKITTGNYNYKPNTFGVAYETDRAYLLWTVTNPSDTEPTQCFRFNTFTTSWTRFPISKTCGIVKPVENRLYLGAGDTNFIEQERKNFDRTDHADRETLLQIPADAVVDLTITLSSAAEVSTGDVLLQLQYLTIYKYNQLLRKLDLDPTVGFKNYLSTLQVFPGADLRAALDTLALKLDTDPGLLQTNFFSSMGHGSSFLNFQNDFNILTSLLNANAFASFSNYPLSTGTVLVETLISSRIKNTNKVTVHFHTPIIQGPVTLSHGIPTEIVWVPQSFGDASIAKQIREGTFLFENTIFFGATVSYSSDLSPDFELIDFNELGIGDWNNFTWGEQNWSGTGNQVPLRTYIPRNKQRCRFLNPRFQHVISRENYALFGISLTFRPLSERAYRE